MKLTKPFCLIAALLPLALFSACEGEDTPDTPTPELGTLSISCKVTASGISTSAATLSGVISTNSGELDEASLAAYGDAGLSAYFLLGTDEASLSTSGTKVDAGTLSLSGGEVSATVSDLEPGTAYYCALAVSLGDLQAVSPSASFTTEAIPEGPITTSGADEITETTATLNGYAIFTGEDISYGIIYSTLSDPNFESMYGGGDGDGKEGGYIGAAWAEERDSDGRFSCYLQYLTPATKYYYRAFLCTYTEDKGEEFTYGEVKEFTTLDFTATLTTMDATDVGMNAATLNGDLNIESKSEIDAYRIFIWSDTLSSADELMENGTRAYVWDSNADGVYSYSLSGLSSNTTYYYMAYAEVGGKELKGEVKEFTTTSLQITVNVSDATDIHPSSAVVSGSVSVNGEVSLTQSFIYSKTASTLDELKESAQENSNATLSDGVYTAKLWWLSPGTTYHYTMCVEVDGVKYYGEVKAFTTGDLVVSVTTGDVQDIRVKSATLHGHASVNDEDLTLSKGFLYSTTATNLEELIAENRKARSNMSYEGSDEYSSSTEGLLVGTKYVYAAYASADTVTVYGEVKEFSTEALDISVTTGDVTDITSIGATVNSNFKINNEGSFSHSSYSGDKFEGMNISFGICYSEEDSTKSWLSGIYAKRRSSDDATYGDREASYALAFGPKTKTGYSAGVYGLYADTRHYYVAYVLVQDRETRNEYWFYGDVREFDTKGYTIITTGAADLGLSVQWAAMDVGSMDPYTYGSTFAWGETTPKEFDLDLKGYETYKWCNGTYSSLTKYNTNSDYGVVDDKTTLEPSDDAATVALGAPWRTPTFAEYEEFWTNTTSLVKDHYAIFVAENGNAIVFPCETVYSELEKQTVWASQSHYWTSTLGGNSNPSLARRILFNFGLDYSYNSRDSFWQSGNTYDNRYNVFAIRPVRDNSF